MNKRQLRIMRRDPVLQYHLKVAGPAILLFSLLFVGGLHN